MRKLKRKNKKIIITIIIILVIILIGIGLFIIFNKDDKDIIKPKKNKTEVKEQAKVNIIDVNSKSRPVAFTIDNSDDSRKMQYGLYKAYLVYEITNYADGRTRFLALYKDSDVEKVGPIRSVRHYHLDYVLENDAILTHWGQSTIAGSDLKSLKIDDLDGIAYGSNKTENNIENGRFFWTDTHSYLDVSHRRYTSMALVNKGLDKLKYNRETDQPNLFEYSGDLIDIKNKEGSKSATKVDIYYTSNNYTTYEYDSSSNKYLRSVKGKSHIDNATGEQLKVTNIITYVVNNYTIPGNVDILQQLENIGSGEGYYITNGYSVPIKWSKECRSCQTKYTYLDGSKVILNDGNTFIQIQPKNRTLNIS